jgi:acyl-coenzyme A thioesterase 9
MFSFIGWQHCSDEDSTTRPLFVVTASVDKMVLKKPLWVDIDLKIAGAVTYVGHSSIDIQIEVTQSPPGTYKSNPIISIFYLLLCLYYFSSVSM